MWQRDACRRWQRASPCRAGAAAVALRWLGLLACGLLWRCCPAFLPARFHTLRAQDVCSDDEGCRRRDLARPLAAAISIFPLLELPAGAEGGGGDGTAERLRRELDGEAPVENPGVSWNLGRFLPDKPGQQLIYPDWMAGTWDVATKYVSASAPLGRRYISDRTPGTRVGTLLTIPDIGSSPSFLQRFLRAPGGAVADRSYNIRTRIEAFLPNATSAMVSYEPEKDPTRIAFDYELPRRSAVAPPGSKLKRGGLIFINNRAGESVTEDSFICEENFRQSSPGFQDSDYKVILALRRLDAERVTGKVRVAAFLTPLDAAYFDAAGKAIAVYDYAVDFRRVAG